MLSRTDPLTPNVKRLIIERCSQLQLEAAMARFGKAGVEDVGALLIEDGVDGLRGRMDAAFRWVAVALEAVRQAPGSERFPDDEAVATYLMQVIDIRLKRKASVG